MALWVAHGLDRAALRILGGIPGLTIWWRYRKVLFGGVYLPPEESLSVEECAALLEPPAGTEYEEIVILGDFNMRLGTMTGDSTTTARGRTLATRLMERGLTLISEAFEEPTFRPLTRDGGESFVDQVWSNLGSARHTETALVGNDDVGGSDHRLIYTRIYEGPEVRPREAQGEVPRLFNLGKLKETGGKKAYQRMVRERVYQTTEAFERNVENMQHAENKQEAIDELEKMLNGILCEAAEAALGSRDPYRRRNTTLWGDSAFREARRQRRRTYQRLRRDPENEELRGAYREARKEQDRALAEARERIFYEFADRVEAMEDTERSKTIASMIRTRTRGKNTLLSCDPESLEGYAAFFQGQLARRDFHRETAEIERPRYSVHGTPFGAGEVHEEKQRLAKGKSPGASGLRNELLIFAPGEFTRLLTALFGVCWQYACVPSAWKVAMIYPVPKKGDMRQISNYRPISLTESMRKLYERVLLGGMLAYIEPLDICQGGFRHDRSTLEQVAALHESIQQRKAATKRWPIVAYLDIKAAYDTVDRRILWDTLVKRNVPREWINMLREMFDHNTSQVTMGGFKSRRFVNEAGLLQGSVLSPVLYAAFINGLPGRLRAQSAFKLGDLDAASFFYADDIAMVVDTKEQLRAMLQTCEVFSQEHGFQFSPAKCEMVTAGEENTGDCCLYGQPLKHSNTFVYLGVTFDAQGISEEAHVSRLAAKTIDSVNLLRTIGFNGYGFAISVKRRMYETFIRPKLEYGLALIKPTATILKIVEGVQYRALCTMFSVSGTTSRAALLGIVGIQSMRQRMTELNAMWSTRVERRRNGFMIHEARKAYDRRGTRRSVFKLAESNPMATEYRDRTVWAGIRVADDAQRIDMVKEIRRGHRRKDRESLWTGDTAQQMEGISRRVGATAQTIDTCVTRRCRRMITLWMLRKIPGRPRLCLNCNLLGRTTRAHVMECCHADPTTRLACGQTVDMLRELSRITSRCLGWPAAKLDRDIVREHTVWERREEARLTAREGNRRGSGAHAFWRYTARLDRNRDE